MSMEMSQALALPSPLWAHTWDWPASNLALRTGLSAVSARVIAAPVRLSQSRAVPSSFQVSTRVTPAPNWAPRIGLVWIIGGAVWSPVSAGAC